MLHTSIDQKLYQGLNQLKVPALPTKTLPQQLNGMGFIVIPLAYELR